MMTQKISLICAMARNHAIGIKNDLPWHLPADLEHFKNVTKGKPIIMGRLTYESILSRRNGKPLPQRVHYVVTRQNLGELPENVYSFPTLQAAIMAAKKDAPEQEIMVIGGASIYEQSVPLVDRMYLTIIDQDIEGDAFFPAWTESDWALVDENQFTDPIPYSFRIYDRR